DESARALPWAGRGPQSGRPSGPLVTQDRPQLPDDARELSLRAHDAADVLVRGRRLVAERRDAAMIEPDALHLAPEIGRAHALPGLRAAHAPARAMRARREGLRAAAALDV